MPNEIDQTTTLAKFLLTSQNEKINLDAELTSDDDDPDDPDVPDNVPRSATQPSAELFHCTRSDNESNDEDEDLPKKKESTKNTMDQRAKKNNNCLF